MSKGDLDAYRQMSTRDVRRWLTASSVVATAFTAAILVIAIHHFGRDPGPTDTQQAAATATSSSPLPSLILAGE
jgi:hypothetical protein